jgi:hypothetical protein
MEEAMLDLFRSLGKLSDVEYETFKEAIIPKLKNTCNCKCAHSGAGASA